MLRDSMHHAGEDLVARRLREQRVEAERVIEALRAALARDGETLLDAAERAQVDQALAQLQAVLDSTDVQRHPARRSRPWSAPVPFYVERRMNQSIQAAMAGHRSTSFSNRGGSPDATPGFLAP